MKWFWERRREAVEEIQAHLAERVDDLVEAGLPPEEALQQARREFGNLTLVTESSSEVWGWVWLDRLGQDLRYAVRMLRRNPGFTAAAVLSLALGIGANTAIFTLIESALWMPIPVRHPEQLRLLSWHGRDRFPPELSIWSEGVTPWGDDRPTPDGGVRHTGFTWPIYEELQRGNTVFDSLFGFRELGRVTAVVDGNAEPVNCFLVSGGFYQGMGLSPAIGRAIGPESDIGASEGAVAVISYGYWTRRFSRNPSALGKKILLNQVPVTIVGVNPAWFTGIEPGANFEIWAPVSLQPRIAPQMGSLFDKTKVWWLSVMGRLKRDVSDAQAQSAFDVILRRQVDVDFPGPKADWQPHLQVESGERGMDHLTNRYGKPLVVLLSLAGLVLSIACANVANLLLAKSAVRRREISLRLALGAGRARIVRQLLTEGLLLACLAGVVGMILGYWVRNGIPALLATSWRPTPFEAAFDPKVLLISLGITFLTGVLFSLAPAWQARRMEVNEALKDGSRGTASLSKLRAGRLLVVFQVAVSLLLLVGAGLFAKTFGNLKGTPIGFNPERILLFRLDPPALRYPKDRVAALYAQLQERSGAIAGVQSASFSYQALLSHSSWRARVAPAGQNLVVSPASMATDIQVGSHFFETIGIRMLYGRALDDRDTENTPRSAVVNSEFGKHFFQNENPLGRSFTINGGTGAYRIVGVCADARYDFLRSPVQPALFRSFAQSPRPGGVTFEVKIAGDPAGIAKQIRQIVRSLDSDLAVTDVRMQTEQIDDTLSQERLLAALACAFGALAILLACIGTYGVTAYAVARRTSEIGIRVALGAQPQAVARMVLRETLLLAAVGIAAGLPAVLALSRYTRSLLYGIQPNDPFILAAAVLTLAAAGFTAGYLPARRAAHVDPMAALRHD